MNRVQGFSLIELLMAMTLTLGLGMAIFELFQQNERLFRDQGLRLEMQQGVRVVAYEVSDIVRIAGQGVPVYSSSFDDQPNEATVAVLAGSTSTRLNVRAGFSNAEAVVTNAQSTDFTNGIPATISVSQAAPFSDVIGTTPAGRFVYLWGQTGLRWGWVRASVDGITAGTNTIRITPRQTHGSAVRFVAAPVISLEEAVAIYHDSAAKTVRRTTATQTTNLTSPGWAPANELATNIASLTFTYYDGNNDPIVPSTLANRAAVRRIDAQVIGQTSATLSNGKREKYTISLTSVSRNMQMR